MAAPVEVARTLVNSRELFKNQEWGIGSRKACELRGMVEVVRTLTPNFAARDYSRTEENDESESLRCPARLGGMMGFELNRTRANSGELG